MSKGGGAASISACNQSSSSSSGGAWQGAARAARLREEEEDDVDALDDEFSSCWIPCEGKKKKERMEEWKSGPLKTKVGSIGRGGVSGFPTLSHREGVRLMCHSREDRISGWHERAENMSELFYFFPSRHD